MTTVGYGDMYPVTLFGRMIGVICAFWGTFIISLLIIVAERVFALKGVENKALNHLMRTRMAAQTITNSMKYFLSKSRYLEKDGLDENIVEQTSDQGGFTIVSNSLNESRKVKDDETTMNSYVNGGDDIDDDDGNIQFWAD